MKTFIRRFFYVVAAAAVLLTIGTLGFLALPEYDLSDALYMTVITLTAVGYEEVHELNDVGRAFAVGWAAVGWLTPEWVPWIGLTLILGNRYPCFHNFKGGKGVANYLGFTLAISPLVALFSGLAWLALFLAFRVPFYASFSMVAVLAVGTLMCVGAHPATVAGVAATIGLIVYSHRRNIAEKIKRGA